MSLCLSGRSQQDGYPVQVVFSLSLVVRSLVTVILLVSEGGFVVPGTLFVFVRSVVLTDLVLVILILIVSGRFLDNSLRLRIMILTDLVSNRSLSLLQALELVPVDLPARDSLRLSPEDFVAGLSIAEDPGTTVLAFIRLAVPLETGVDCCPPLLSHGFQVVELLASGCPANGLPRLKLEPDVVSSQLYQSLLELLIPGPEPLELSRVNILQTKGVSGDSLSGGADLPPLSCNILQDWLRLRMP